MKKSHWSLRFTLFASLLNMMVAPLMGQTARLIFIPDHKLAGMYFMLAFCIWPFMPVIYTLVFKPDAIG